VLRSADEVLLLLAGGNHEVGRSFVRELQKWFPGHADYLDSALAAWIQRSPPRLFFGRHEEALAHASRLQRLRPGEALVIRFGDDPSALVRLVALPGEALRFAYTSDEEEAAQKPLVERCARALDCDLVPF
jgi:hypothetical protein